MPRSRDSADLDLFRLQFEGLAGPLAPPRGIRFVSNGAAGALLVGAGVSADLAQVLETARASARPWTDARTPPPALAASVKRLVAEGWTVKHGSTQIVYVIAPDLHVDSDIQIECSGRPIPRWLRSGNPGDWHPVEWDELLDGQLGPWSMATHEGQVVSICHTPVPVTDQFAEAGVWTAPEFRGRGYAAAVTAAWAALVAHPGRRLFYSTDLENRSSQRVAARLKLRRLGFARALSDANGEPPLDAHPLSRLNRT